MTTEADIRRRKYRQMLADTTPLAWLDRTTLDTVTPVRHGAVKLADPVEGWLQSRYAAPRPEVRIAPRPPLARRLTPIGRALAWCWRKRGDAAALVMVGLACYGAWSLMGALIRAGGI